MSKSPYIVNVTSENFAAIVLEGSRSQPVLVDFWAAWCNPCQILVPILAKLVDEMGGSFILAKVDTEEQRELAAQYAIRSLPTVKLFKDGQPVDEFLGALPEAEIRAFLDKHIPRASDNLLAQAQGLIQHGRVTEAVQLIEEARASDPGNTRTQIAYARLKATLGEIADAEAALADLPADEQAKPEVISLRTQMLFDQIALAAPPAGELEKALASDPGDSAARYQLAARKVMESNYEAALELLMALVQKDRQYGEDAGRKGMLAIFDLLGGSGDLVSRYRSRLFNALH